MLNFLVTDISQVLSINYFQYIIQFESQLDADIWFIENDIRTEEFPYYNKEIEIVPFYDKNISTLNTFLSSYGINKLVMIEATSYKVLCFTEQSYQKFTGNVIKGSVDEKLEFTEVDKHFIYGFANPS